MKKVKSTGLDFEIDKLTNSIQNTISGDSFQTEVSLLIKSDFKHINKKVGGILIGKMSLMTTQKKFTS